MAHRSWRMVLVVGLLGGLVVPALVPALVRAPAAVASSGPSALGTSAVDASTAYQVNSSHDGRLASGVERPPLAKAWTRDLDGPVSYPLVVDGRVFITARNNWVYGGPYGTTLYALDAETGEDVWGPIDLGGTHYWSALTYGFRASNDCRMPCS